MVVHVVALLLLLLLLLLLSVEEVDTQPDIRMKETRVKYSRNIRSTCASAQSGRLLQLHQLTVLLTAKRESYYQQTIISLLSVYISEKKFRLFEFTI